MKKITLNAPAKINLGLNIVSKRPDGFHNLETFFYPINNLCDNLIFEKSDSILFESNNKDLIGDPENLILKAHSLAEQVTDRRLPIKITLIKNIPIGAGLGGGSSDAAGTLIGLNKIYDLGIGFENLNELALKLGSDVPFFLKSIPAVGYARGEILSQSNVKISKPILIVNPGIHISTKEAFGYITPKESDFDYEYFLQNEKIDLAYLQKELKNDFEDYVFNTYPEIKNIKQTMINSEAIFSMMSGTGSTVYGIFENVEEAKEASDKLPDNYFKFISK